MKLVAKMKGVAAAALRAGMFVRHAVMNKLTAVAHQWLTHSLL